MKNGGLIAGFSESQLPDGVNENNVYVIKIGGSVLESAESVVSFCLGVQHLSNLGLKVVIVHGGGKAINAALTTAGIESAFVDGLRVTSVEAVGVIEKVLSQQINTVLVAGLAQQGVNAVSMPGSKLLCCDPLGEQYGYVGKIHSVLTDVLDECWLKHQMGGCSVPVISSIGLDASGQVYNINADTAASALAIALHAKKMIYLTDQEGIKDQEGVVVERADVEHLKQLIDEKVVLGGMLAKVNSIVEALNQGIEAVSIINGHKKGVLNTILSGDSIGTLCHMATQQISVKKKGQKVPSLITGAELDKSTIIELLRCAHDLKRNSEKYKDALAGKEVALSFDKPSLRTRLSFSSGISKLGGHSTEVLSTFRKDECPSDMIQVVQGYCDALMMRTHSESIFEEMLAFADIPIINGLSDNFHPCQSLADLMTLQEKFGYLEGLKIAYIGDANNVFNSLGIMATAVGVKVHYCCPPGHQPQKGVLSMIADQSLIHAFESPQLAVKSCNAVYTDVWSSMGFSDKNEDDFIGFQVDESLMSCAHEKSVFMHCMPMERGKEVSASLPDSDKSVVFSQSENRLYVQQAVLLKFLNP